MTLYVKRSVPTPLSTVQLFRTNSLNSLPKHWRGYFHFDKITCNSLYHLVGDSTTLDLPNHVTEHYELLLVLKEGLP